MCGMKIVSIGTDAKGNINIEELRKAAKTHKDKLSTLMVQLLNFTCSVRINFEVGGTSLPILYLIFICVGFLINHR